MQQAECGRSPRRGDAPTGKTDKFTGHTIVLAEVDVGGRRYLSDHAHLQLATAGTLLRAASEAAQEAGCERGFWSRTVGWERERFQHIESLITLVERELDQLTLLLSQASRVPGVRL